MKRSAFVGGGLAAVGAARGIARAQILSRPVTIGVAVPLTGPQADFGAMIAGGVRAACDETNRGIGPTGRSFLVRTFDDQNSDALARNAAAFCTADPTISACIGHLGGSVTDHVLQTYANSSLALVVPASSLDSITAHGYRNVFRLPTKDSTEGQLFARFLARTSKPKLAIALTQDGAYGPAVAQAFVDQAKAEHFSAQPYTFAQSKPDFISVAAKVLAQSPDYVFLAGNSDDMGPVIPALRRAGFTGAFGASQGFYTMGTLQSYAHELRDGYISTSMPPLDRLPNPFGYFADLRREFGTVSPLVAFGFAAAQLVIAAVNRGGSDRASVVRTIANTGSIQTLVGSFTFSFSGDPFDPNLYFYAIADGKFTYKGAYHPGAFL